MQYIECTAVGAVLTATETPAMAAGFADVFAVKCDYDEAWDGLDARVASFRVVGSKPTSVVEADGCFVVPPEVNAGPSFEFSVSGTAGDGRRITTNTVNLKVAPSVPVGDEAGDPTPSVSAQALEAAQAAAQSAADALAKAAQALTDAATALTAAQEAESKADAAKTAADGVVETAEAASAKADAAAAAVAPATASTLGTVKVGDGLSVTEDGVLSADGGAALAPATADTLGGVKVGDGLSVTEDGTLSAEGGGGEIADGSVTTSKLADGAVTTAKIANKSITDAKIADNTLLSNKFASSGGVSVMWPTGSVFTTTKELDATTWAGKASLPFGNKSIAPPTWELLDSDGTVWRYKRVS